MIKLVKSIRRAVDNIFLYSSPAQKRKFHRHTNILISHLRHNSLIDDALFYLRIEKWLATLRNGHTKLKDYPTKRWYGPKGYRVYYSNFKYYLFQQNKLIGQIIKIDGQPVRNIHAVHKKRIAGGSDKFIAHQAAKFLLLDPRPLPISLILSKAGKHISLTLPRRHHKPTPPPPWTTKLLASHIGYIHAPQWNDIANDMIKIERVLKRWSKLSLRGIIIDVRGNGGGNSNLAFRLAGHFNKKPIIAGTVKYYKTRPTRIYSRPLYIQPQKPYISCPIILLTNLDCLSSNELFIAALHDTRRAVTCGDYTGGSSGNPIIKRFTAGQLWCTVQIATWGYIRPNGKYLEGLGIKPDIPGPTKISQLIDPNWLIKKAQRWILEKYKV